MTKQLYSFFKIIFKCIYLFIFGSAGSSLLHGLFFFLIAMSVSYSLVAIHEFLTAVASPVEEHKL